MTSPTRTTLLDRLRGGADPVAWDEFFQRYWRLIYAFARHRGCSHETAEDVVQDVLLEVFEHKDVFQYDPQRGRFRDWLGILVRNRVVDRRRRASERDRARGGDSGSGRVEIEDDGAPPDAAWESEFEQALLMVLLDVVRREADPRDYLAFELLTLGELPGAAVADITGLSRNAAYKARRRVLERLLELGEPYREDGRLGDRVRQALRSLPDAAIERKVTTRIERTLRWR